MDRKGIIMIVIRVGPRVTVSTIISTTTKLRQENYNFEASMDKKGRSKRRGVSDPTLNHNSNQKLNEPSHSRLSSPWYVPDLELASRSPGESRAQLLP